jgi:hypothetical protein
VPRRALESPRPCPRNKQSQVGGGERDTTAGGIPTRGVHEEEVRGLGVSWLAEIGVVVVEGTKWCQMQREETPSHKHTRVSGLRENETCVMSFS